MILSDSLAVGLQWGVFCDIQCTQKSYPFQNCSNVEYPSGICSANQLALPFWFGLHRFVLWLALYVCDAYIVNRLSCQASDLRSQVVGNLLSTYSRT